MHNQPPHPSRRSRTVTVVLILCIAMLGAASPAIAEKAPANGPIGQPAQGQPDGPAAVEPIGPALDVITDPDQLGPFDLRQRAAVALGDSFISGEGAGDYQSVRLDPTDPSSLSTGIADLSEPDSNAYFCHRSANAAIEVAELTGIDVRFNLACSGAHSCHVMAGNCAPSPDERATGSKVPIEGLEDLPVENPNTRVMGPGLPDLPSQANQLAKVAADYNVELVLIGLGSNGSAFTFGGTSMNCVLRFAIGSFAMSRLAVEVMRALLVGLIEIDLTDLPPMSEVRDMVRTMRSGCTVAELSTIASPAHHFAEVNLAVETVIETLDRAGQPPGSYRIVLQDYTNPLATSDKLDAALLEEDDRTDTSKNFRELFAERWDAGCPAHRVSLAAGHALSTGLGLLTRDVANKVREEHPAAIIQYLNVQSAFDGARVCEAGATRQAAIGMSVHEFSGGDPRPMTAADFDKASDFTDYLLDGPCSNGFLHMCQESWHPNKFGHELLAECLDRVWAVTRRHFVC